MFPKQFVSFFNEHNHSLLGATLRRLLSEQGCDRIQGWWCGRPLEPAAFAEILRSESLGSEP